MDLLALNYFRTVARYEHMTRAAEHLTIAQSSLSQTIARLERELGVPLFERQGRRIRLNRFGEAFLQRVERVFSELEAGQHELNDLAETVQGQITLAFSSIIPFVSLLHDFRELFPQIEFRLSQQSAFMQMLPRLTKGEIDLCFCTISSQDDYPGLHWEPLLTEEIFLVVPSTHPLAKRRSIHLSEVAQESFIALEPGNALRDMMDAYCKQVGFIPKVVFEGNEPSALQELVPAGLGVGFIPATMWQSAARTGVQRLRIKKPVCQRTIGLAWYPQRYYPLAVRRFRQFVIEHFSDAKTHLQAAQT